MPCLPSRRRGQSPVAAAAFHLERGSSWSSLAFSFPFGSRGWLISTTAPETSPTFDLNRTVVQQAEHYGLDFALAMIKLRGFDGPSRYWQDNLEAFTMMAAIAAVTSKIKLYASIALLTLPPALAARMAVTIDSVAPGRFGVNIVTGWQPKEYQQMGLWPGDEHFRRRYDYAAEYVTVMKDLWSKGVSNFKGDYFQMDDCRLSRCHPHRSISSPPVPVMPACALSANIAITISSAPAAASTMSRVPVTIPPPAGGDCTLWPQGGRLYAADDHCRPHRRTGLCQVGNLQEGHGPSGDRMAEGAICGRQECAATSTAARMAARASEMLAKPESAEPSGMLRLIGSYEKVAAMLDVVANSRASRASC